MAQFNVDAHLSNGKRLDWIALPEGNETPDDVLRYQFFKPMRGCRVPQRRPDPPGSPSPGCIGEWSERIAVA